MTLGRENEVERDQVIPHLSPARYYPAHLRRVAETPHKKRKEVVYSRLLVEHEDICATLEESVRGRETGETTTDDDNLGHN